jgi:hypothetical protein
MDGLMEYQLPDGRIITGHNALEVVEAMAETKFTAPRSRKSYRVATAKRTQAAYNVEVDATTDETFVADLERHNLLQRLI